MASASESEQGLVALLTIAVLTLITFHLSLCSHFPGRQLEMQFNPMFFLTLAGFSVASAVDFDGAGIFKRCTVPPNAVACKQRCVNSLRAPQLQDCGFAQNNRVNYLCEEVCILQAAGVSSHYETAAVENTSSQCTVSVLSNKSPV